VESIRVSVGDEIRAGAVLGQFWSPDLATASEEYALAKTQKDQGLVKLTEEKLRAIGVDPADAKPSEKSYPLRAPISGVVMDRKVNSGSSVQVGDVMFILGKLGKYQFVGEVPPDTASRIKTGMKVVFEDRPDLSAQVRNVNPISDPVTNLVKVRCEFDQAKDAVIPQEVYLKARVVLSTQTALVAPLKSLVMAGDRPVVFVGVEGNPNRFVKTEARVLERSTDSMSLEPTGEVKRGARIVADGAVLLEGILESD
jgi:multidrug efflux pump subunit AcrA (membrane-fusion protein)